MGQPLTPSLRAALDAAATSGKRDVYYNLLAGAGYSYGNLAYDVAFNRGINGAVANTYARSIAASVGITLTEQKWTELSIALMRADWSARGGINGGATTSDLNWQQYRNYHQAEFAKYGLPITAWTADIPLSDAGSYAASAQMWQDMLNAQSFTAQLTNGGNVFLTTSGRNPLYQTYTAAELANGPGPGIMSSAAYAVYAFKNGIWKDTPTEARAAQWTSVMTSAYMLGAIAKNVGILGVEQMLGQPASPKLRSTLDRLKQTVSGSPFPAMLYLPIELPTYNYIPPFQDKPIYDNDGNPIGISYGYFFNGAWVETSSTVTLFARDNNGHVVKDAANKPIQLGRDDSKAGGLTVRRMYASGTENVISHDCPSSEHLAQLAG